MTTQVNAAPRAAGTPRAARPGEERWTVRLLRTDHDHAQTLLRVVLGAVMFPHGAQHLPGWFGGYGFRGTLDWMVSLGFPAPLAALAIVVEFFAP
ncbi:MAG TPA: DoxX family protein, partial [Longimicrobiaceae bacterium]|nr:DoxX family protein [Longimicrobiaceae bacterium]